MYDPKHSFDAQKSPPHDNGQYWVRTADGNTPNGPVEWRDGEWISEQPVTRYSGDNVRQLLERRIELLESVAAGIALMRASDNLPERRKAQTAALMLARHFASAATRRGIAADRANLRQRTALGFYVVAQQLGLSFDEKHNSGPVAKTDRVLMSEFGERFPGVRAGVARTAQAESVTGEFMEWALTAIEGHKKVKAKRQR
ncbi:hypothetical protein [Paraburkholderia domus]|uniref:hypothetical protein n=1 Tax=Paraburkholderia domus TaxID=2793075 RepID=UPI001913D24E|nr:hypothetical protein [Paraburkholderia domus]MBK5066363.1 hypothetical protein [Burkholderia sp. R-70199]CAE6969658.1 hypothetical protein R70199_08098 [Paraburkholderia domus]